MTNTNDREALAALLRKHGDMTDRSSRDGCSCDEGSTGRDYEEHAADAILAAGFTRQPKPHTVETVEELQALSPGTPLRFANGDVSIASHRLSYYPDAVDETQLGRDFPAIVLAPATQPAASEIAKQAAELLATISAIGLSRIDVTAMEALIEFMRGSVASEPTEAQVEAAARALHVNRDHSLTWLSTSEKIRGRFRKQARAALSASAKVGSDA